MKISKRLQRDLRACAQEKCGYHLTPNEVKQVVGLLDRIQAVRVLSLETFRASCLEDRSSPDEVRSRIAKELGQLSHPKAPPRHDDLG